jgi:HEAT repeat protein
MSNSPDRALTDALAQLRSDDVLVQNEGVAALIGIGAAAVSSLLPLLDEKPAGLRAQVMYALARIAEPETAEAFQRGLKDSDERVRAYAADGLARIGHTDAMAASLQTLNDAPNEAHMDMTPAVYSLGKMGLKAVPELLDLLMSEDESTRLHAQRALEMILNGRHGFQFGQGFPTPEADNQARAEWQANGNYDYAADAASRAASVEKWRSWLATQKQ